MTGRTVKIALAAASALMFVAAVAPASAQPWGPPGPPPSERWGGPPPREPGWGHRPHRQRCWYEERRVKVWTDHGPRWRTRQVKVCN